MSDIIVALPDNLGTVSFPEGTPASVIERESANAYLRAKGTAAGKSDAARSRDQGISQAFGNGVVQGLGDEATAAVRSALPQFSNWMMRGPALKRDDSIGGSPPDQTVSDAPTYEGRYEEELARERAKKKAFAGANPVTAGVATVAGSVAPMALAGMAGLPVAPQMGPGLWGNLAKSAATGAGYGGLFGFNEGEGGLSDRLGTAGEGALFGSLMGPAFYLGGRGLGAGWDFLKATPPGQAALQGVQKVADLLDRGGSVPVKSASAAAAPDSYVPGDNPLTYAADQIRAAVPSPEQALKERAASFIATAVQRGKMTPQQAQVELDKLGTGATLADVNKGLFRATRMTNTLPGETGDLAQNVMAERAKTYNPTLRTAIEGPSPPPDDFYFRGKIPGGNIPEKYAQEVGRRVYGAMDDAGFKNSPAVSRLMEENPQVASAVDRVLTSLKAARQGTDRSPESVVQVMHMVKREIQKIGLDANGRPSSTAYQWQQTADNFVDALKRANPELASADVAYAKAKSVPDHYAAGLGVFGKASTAEGAIERSAPAIENMMRVADAAQGNATVFGAINAGRAKTGGNVADAIGFARTISESEEARRKIAVVFGEQRAREIFNAADKVLRFNKTSQGLLGGSQSIDKAAELFSSGADLGNAGVRVTPGGIVPRFFQTANDILQRIAAPNEPVRNQMGQMLLNTSPFDNRATLEMVNEILRRRAAQQSAFPAVGGSSAVPFGLAGSQNP